MADNQVTMPGQIQADPELVITVYKTRLTEEIAKNAVFEAALLSAQGREQQLMQELFELKSRPEVAAVLEETAASDASG